MTRIQPPTAYQGGKCRLASDILNYISPNPAQPFFDVCCGSGAVSIELVNRGFPVQNLTMVDKGPWGLFWQAVGNGTFDVDRFTDYCAKVPDNPVDIKLHLETLAKQPVDSDAPYVFLLLQAGSFGGKAIWVDGTTWRTHGFRDFWLPTATSIRRSHTNPMMPMPATLLERTKEVCNRMKGVKAFHADASEINPPIDAVVYIDPPYAGTTKYGHGFDAESFARNQSATCYVSEGVPLSEYSFLLSAGRRKGGISGSRRAANEEWLTKFGGVSEKS